MSLTPAAPAPETALARTPTVITTPDEYRAALQLWQDRHYHVLAPFAHISGLAAQHGIFTSVVQINLDKHAAQVYADVPFLKRDIDAKRGDDEVALAKNGLRMIGEGLGISTKLEYISVGALRYYWHVKAIASYRGLDGGLIQREASEEWDLRDGSDRLNGWTPNQISEGRKHGLRNCETRAINAAIRECGCGLKQAYRKSELRHPFVTARIAFQPDMTDPDQRRMVLERSLSGSQALYAGVRDATLSEELDDARGPRFVGRGSTSAPPEPDPEPDPNQPPTASAVRIVAVAKETGKSKAGRSYSKWTVTDSLGAIYTTHSEVIADAARTAATAQAWVEIVDESGTLVELSPALPDLGAL